MSHAPICAIDSTAGLYDEKLGARAEKMQKLYKRLQSGVAPLPSGTLIRAGIFSIILAGAAGTLGDVTTITNEVIVQAGGIRLTTEVTEKGGRDGIAHAREGWNDELIPNINRVTWRFAAICPEMGCFSDGCSALVALFVLF